MHLKEIQMENFKTFRKKVVIPIYEGFTGVTGPNGSGKSNVADAVLFVLGPRSSKMVRAKRLEDLIFHGNDKFKPANECKVTLVFDNTDRTIPIDSDHVSLKRVIRRSTSDPNNTLSYFYVNGRVSSQNQFESILTHAHLSAEGYNIVLQGHISEFINKTPVRIREEIDEIAGIRKYDEEVNAAQAKKTKTEANMEKIQWLLEQIRTRLRELKKEKEEAEKYKTAQEQINQTKALLYHVQETAVRGEIDTYHQAIDNAEKRKIDLRGEIERLESERAGLEKEIREIEAEIDDITGEEGKKLKVKLDEAKLELMRARDIIITAEDSISELGSEASLREQEKKDISKKLDGLGKEITSSEEGIRKVNEKINGQQDKIDHLEQEQEKTDLDLLNLRRELGKVSKELETTRDNLSVNTLERDRNNNFLDVKRNQNADTEQMVSTLEYEVADLKKEMSAIKQGASNGSMERLQKDYMSARSEEKLLGGRMRSIEQEITSLNRVYTQLKVELETSEKLNKGISLAVDDLLTARDKGEIRGLHGTIGELGNVPEKYALAMEVAAGGRISSLIVKDDQVASNCIEHLKKKKLGRATFLPLNKMAVRRPGAKALMIKDDPHVIGLAVDLIDFSDEYRNAFSWVFGDTVVVDDLNTLRRLMGGVRLVTLTGEIAGAGGDITGGSLNQKKGSSGFGKRSASELENVSSQLKEKMAESDAVTASLNEARDRVSELETKIRKITSEQSDTEGKKKKAEEALRSSTEQLGLKKEELKVLIEEMGKLQKISGELEGKVRELEARVSDLAKERDGLQDKVEMATPKAVRDRLRSLREERDSLMVQRTSLVEARDSARAQLSLFQERKRELEGRSIDIAKAVKKAEEEKVAARERETRFDKEVKALEAVLSTIDSKTKDLYERRNELGREVERLLAQRENARSSLMSQDQIIITQRSNIRTAEDKLADILAEKQGFLQVKLPDPPYPTERDMLRTVREIEAILENAGNVNLKALEEYEETEKKKVEITEEMKSLEKEKEELQNLISEIDRKRKEEFMHVYEGIDRNFKEIYQKVSGGGEAFFELERPDDPLSGGLHIHVRPPGKKMTRLNALSGGEKSLTSMAFIFSVQSWDPSPFYLLDEVDQNLDAINAEIIAKLVRENSKYAQFVMISLRKISLKEAHHLYGVTLQKGESVILGRVELKDVDSYEKGDGSAMENPVGTEEGDGE
ncbi:MAG: chromosome segregation protein SMC [Candidatus Thermoplasmatota archaeon]|nr:chromosome segregation protein SMC [Candidatus Thermoplasmatota archaeon]